MGFTDNMTLDEVAAVDNEMAKDAIRNAKRYTFFRRDQANYFISYCLKSTIERLGIKGANKMADRMLERLQETHGIKIERRTHNRGTEEWRNGFYIYQHDELVTFVSDIQFVRSSILLLNTSPDKFVVTTNAKGPRKGKW